MYKKGQIPQEILKTLPPAARRSIENGDKELPLEPESLSVHYYKKDDWQVWANPMIYAILDDIIMLEKMRLADLSALDGGSESIEAEIPSPPGPPAPPSMDALLPPSPPGPPGPPEPPSESPTDHFDPPEPIAPAEPTFDKVDIASWDSNWNEDWSERADVYVQADSKHSPTAIQDDVEWSPDSDGVPVTKDQVALPNEAALKRMKKADLVQLAKDHKVASSGTKADIIARLLA